MEQIVKTGDGYRYGKIHCDTVDDAYSEFRADYHAGLGRDASRRLDRLGGRRERIHGFGFCFDQPLSVGDDGRGVGKIPYRMLGLVGIHYCRILGCWDFPDIPEPEFESWLDYILSKGSGTLRLVGKDKSGRTDPRWRKVK